MTYYAEENLTIPDTCPYALTDVRGHVTHDGGVAFAATLTHDGEPFAAVSQEGRGGCDLIRPLHPGDRARIDAYRAYAGELLEPQGVVYEPEDLLTALLLEHWEQHQTARAHHLN